VALEIIMLCELSQTQRQESHVFFSYAKLKEDMKVERGLFVKTNGISGMERWTREGNGSGEYDQSTLYTRMKSHTEPIIMHN
jgi:hypothetical protein